MPLNYSYVPTVPQGNQQINNTQESIKNDFYDIYDLLAINHVPFNTPNTFGRHNFVSYVAQGTDPLTQSNEMALYSKTVSDDPDSVELFYRYPNNGNVVQLSGIAVSQSTSAGTTTLTSGGQFYTTDATSFGEAISGFWQYLSNNVLLMSFTFNNYYLAGQTSPFTITLPSAVNGGIYNGPTPNIQVPAYTQTPFNVQMAAGGAQNTGSTFFSVVATSPTTLTAYYTGTLVPSGSTIEIVYVTVIGV